ncbi:flagellar motor switch protein FliG [Microvirga tunisiensis]|jgi:flagellar motor switch protein FliG|uniref:Flagellar motor switch protein FliG n=1 Tax=Microvirga tunisiensis TaxID=2108360 RepID=A0A5N7MPF8_9HYPH|nr:flagellar motor switch protein FliG [Microvirga tunisiensis]MPR10729.1 flagellar motor switch protein FliG [Microvirga tunisiensis]MPR28885.1 flagellar motor switch protein FliG [Microvirga tunisiensis]
MVAHVPMKANGTKVLKGPERVATLLFAMGKPAASRILKHFSEEEIRLVTKSAAQLGPVSPTQIEQLVEEFASNFSDGADLVGGAAHIEKLLTGILSPEQIANIMSEVVGSANKSIWERISTVSESAIASYLMKEHPQTAALILSKVKPSCAAKVMTQLPQPLRNNLMRRMLSMKPIVDETMKNIEKTLHEDFMANFSKNAGSDTHAKIADIINKMERDHMEDVLSSLSSVRPKSAEILRGLLFTFDDIVKLTPRDRTTLFDQVPPDRVVLALKGTNDEFRKVVLSALSSRVRRMIEHELNSKEPSAHRDIAEARRTITDLALEMAGRGEIVINSETEDEAYF